MNPETDKNTNPEQNKPGRIGTWLDWLLSGTGQTHRKQRRGRWTRSNAPKLVKERQPRNAKPRKPTPAGRVELVARQKKARSGGKSE